jgi:acyl-CoA thioester hydrolase
LNISYKKMEEDGVMLPVVSLSIKYKKSAFYDDVINVKTQLVKSPTASIEFEYEITNEAGQILATANTILAFINKSSNRPMRCPQFVLDKLN